MDSLSDLLNTRKERRLGVFLILLSLMLFLLSLFVGEFNLNIINIIEGLSKDNYNIDSVVFQHIRLPRSLLAIIIGASLGLSGAALQGLLRNPLAEPGIIGVSASAALGAVLVFYSGLSLTFPLALPLGGITGALLSVTLLYLLAGRNSSVLTLILAGVAISSLAGSLTALALNLAPNPFASMEIFYWLMGSLSNASMEHVWLLVLPTVLGWWLIFQSRHALDVLSLGEDTASTLGINLATLNKKLILGTALCVGAAVSVSGGIAFIGLIVPHLLRPLVGHRPSSLLFVSAVAGAALLLFADIIVRLLPTQQELKIGVLTALIGAPFFLRLILNSRRAWAS